MSGGVRLARAATRVRTDLPLGLFDGLFVAAAYAATLLLRYDDMGVPAGGWAKFRSFLPAALAVHISVNWVWGLYGQMWRHASVAEARRVLLAGLTSSSALYIGATFVDETVPRSVIILGGIVAMLLMGGLRFQSRLFAFHHSTDRSQAGLRVAVVGAGEASATIIREMQRNPATGLRPVVAVDDDPRKHGLSMLGVPVTGPLSNLRSVVERYGAHQVLLAIPSASQALVRYVASAADEAGVPLKVLPRVRELVGQASVRDVRDLNIEDLLGRMQVDTDLNAVRELINNRTLLITGAGGSIGSEIARQVAGFGPRKLVLLDHDETHLHDAAATLGHDAELVLADIRDAEGLEDIMRLHEPNIVFHAAAHKHVPLLEGHPIEAFRTNVLGTLNVVEAAAHSGVERLVFISTDKAVRPSSVMGASKWLGEQILLDRAPRGSAYCGVRFGNVLGSRGSVIPTFARQIAAGGPVTITDPRMTRFFMSVREAVQLVLQATTFAEGGEVFMLEMGQPVNILSLAERMIRLSGREAGTDIPIRITGIRPGEKLVEDLRAPSEEPQPTPHSSIVRLYPQPVTPGTLEATLQQLAEHTERDDADCVRKDLLALANASDKEVVIDLTAAERASWDRLTT